MRPTVYVETTVVSYLAARPSRDLVTAAHQQLTREWWEEYRDEFELFISQAVVREAAAGDPGVAALRLSLLAGIPALEVTVEVLTLASALVRTGAGVRVAGDLQPRRADRRDELMWTDPIVQEIRDERAAHAERFGYDLEAIWQDLKEQKRRSDRPVVSLRDRRSSPSRAPAA